MKKRLIIAGLICAVQIPPAAAVTKCVALGASTKCYTQSSGGGNWSASCTTSDTTVNISGVAMCSEDEATIGTSRNSLTISSSDGNYQCWCKMTSPAVSYWCYAGKSGSNTVGCISTCTTLCARQVANSLPFRSAMFVNLSD